MRPRRRRERGQSVVEFALVLPIMLVVLLAILDLSRIYTTMTSVESAAREAADYGTTLGAGKWQAGTPAANTIAEMKKRACIAASDLPDYENPPANLATAGCTNPNVEICLTAPTTVATSTWDGGTCYDPARLPPKAGCEDTTRDPPCTVTVTLTHTFRLISPFHIEFLGVEIGVPSSLTFTRDSTFAMTDIGLSTAEPGP